MAFTRKWLQALGIEADKVEEIILAHSEVVEGIKTERDTYKADADKLVKVQKENEDLKKQVSDNPENEFKKKFDDVSKELSDLKQSIKDREILDNKKAVYTALLKESGVSEKRIDSIIKVTDLSNLEIGDDGKFKDSDKISESVKKEWADFIEKPVVQGAKTPQPPKGTGTGTGMTKKEIMAIKDGNARRQAIMDNPELFGISIGENND